MVKRQVENEQDTQLYVPADATVRGDMSLSGDIRIEGTVIGNVSSSGGNLMFGSKSYVSGNVTGVDISTGGKIAGDINATGQLSVFSGAQLLGDVAAAAILVENGAAFRGKVTIGDIKEDSIPAPKEEAAEQ